MSLRKKIKNNETISFNHPILSIEFFNKKYYKIHLKQHSDDWSRILNDTLDKIEQDKLENTDIVYYYLKRSEYNDFIELVENVERKLKRSQDQDEKENDDEEEESSEESESSTDDELIQKTLTRRLTSQSKAHEIDDGHVSDSEMEDVISLCRRFRTVYKLITNMAKRIERLEDSLLPPK